MHLEQQLDESISRWNLLESRFYQAWSEGCLPQEALARYANEYGAFISLIPRGWASHGDSAIAAEEREHVELWRCFAEALGVDIGEAKTPAVRELVETADALFSDPTTSLGALYAFEAQQPRTAATRSSWVAAREASSVDPEAWSSSPRPTWSDWRTGSIAPTTRANASRVSTAPSRNFPSPVT